MLRLPTQLKATGNDILRSVSATTSVITHASESLSALAEAGSIRAASYRDDTAASIAEASGIRRSASVARAKLSAAQQLLDVKHALEADEALWDIYDSLEDADFTFQRPSAEIVSIAAE